MAAKHRYRRPTRHPSLVAAIGGAALGIAGIGAYAAVNEAPAPELAAASETIADPDVADYVVQHGTVVAISDSTLTTRDAAGSMLSYRITPGTTSVTPEGSGPVPTQFTVGDTVSIQATVTDDASVATAVVDSNVANLQGAPMDSIDPSLAVTG